MQAAFSTPPWISLLTLYVICSTFYVACVFPAGNTHTVMLQIHWTAHLLVDDSPEMS